MLTTLYHWLRDLIMDHSINIYKDVITSELCDELIALHKKEKKYTEKEVYTQDTNVQCYNLFLDDYPEYDKKVFDVVEGIIDRVLEDHIYFPDNLDYESYAIREHYGGTALHTDGFFDKVSKRRILSIIIALSDDYDGGVFNFPEQSYQVKLKRGEAITFPPNYFYPHEVSPPSNGERYSISLWVLIDPSG